MNHHHVDRSRPIFVDDTGRRCSIVRTLGRAVAIASVALVSLSAAALTMSPSVSTPMSQHGSAGSQPILAVDHAAKRP